MKRIIYLLAATFFFSSCEKELSLEGALTEQPQPDDTIPKYQLTAFYSDIPIDFDESDGEVKKETDLWQYVFEYVKDDYHILHPDGMLEVIQNLNKLPGVEDDVLYRTYEIGTDDLGDYMNYLTPEYEPRKYRLHEMGEDHFILALKWKDGAHVFSRFEKVK